MEAWQHDSMAAWQHGSSPPAAEAGAGREQGCGSGETAEGHFGDVQGIVEVVTTQRETGERGPFTAGGPASYSLHQGA